MGKWLCLMILIFSATIFVASRMWPIPAAGQAKSDKELKMANAKAATLGYGQRGVYTITGVTDIAIVAESIAILKDNNPNQRIAALEQMQTSDHIYQWIVIFEDKR